MRAANGKAARSREYQRQISVITVNGDKASVAVIKEGLTTPALERAGAVIWIGERGTGKAQYRCRCPK